LPTDAATREAMAGEYVLGTLDARTSQRIAAALPLDPLWRKAVDEWEARLAPLATLARPEAPPPDTWDRIESRFAPALSPQARRRRRFAWLWRLWAMGATGAAVAVAVYAFMPRPQPVRMLTVLVTDRNAPGLTAEADRAGTLRLGAYAAPTGRQLQAPSGRDLQIWALNPGMTAPVSLGLLPHEPRGVTIFDRLPIQPQPGMLIEITVEPEHGSPTGKPTGPVVFYGRMSEAAPGG
jgi:anti-sigma-K factor RskA